MPTDMVYQSAAVTHPSIVTGPGVRQ